MADLDADGKISVAVAAGSTGSKSYRGGFTSATTENYHVVNHIASEVGLAGDAIVERRTTCVG